ncbi:MAG TPA: endonuclease/exonuclease/phosphatase family protein, partial [Candidatus Paceibacterota bacterium]
MEKEHRLKLVSLNIELDRHLDKVLPFLQQERADVICLQEVREKNFATLERGLHLKGFFVPTCVPDVERVVDKRAAGEGRLVVNEELVKKGPEGIALFTGLPVHSTHIDYYHKISEAVPRWSVGQNRVLFSAIVDKGGKNYTVGTTHFTWTP